MAICWERAAPLVFHLCCFYFSAVLIVGVHFPLWKSIVTVPDHCLCFYFANCRYFAQWDANSQKILAKRRGLNLVSGVKLHDFEIICPAMGVRSHPSRPTCVRAWVARKLNNIAAIMHKYFHCLQENVNQ